MNENVEKSRRSIDFSLEKFSKLEKKEIQISNTRRTVVKSYKQSEIRNLIDNYNVKNNQKQLREISELLYERSTQYKRLIKHFAGMPIFPYVLIPNEDLRSRSAEEVRKEYREIGTFLDVLNIKHEMGKVVLDVFKKETFYGYLNHQGDTCFIQPFDNEICMITSIEDGVFNFSIDMSIFDSDATLLDFYPKEVEKKYKKWKNHKGNKQPNKNSALQNWVELDSENTICIKLNEEKHNVSVPMFTGTFESIFDIDGFKQLRKDREELQNYMIISQQLPIRTDSEDNNDFLIDRDTMNYFHNTIADSLPDNVALITSPMKLDHIKFDKDTIENDGVTKAERAFWESSGTSQSLFNSVNGSASSISMSIKTDESIVLTLLNQIERWINRLLKKKFNNPLFKAEVLGVTRFNQNEIFEKYLKASQFGIPVKSHIGAIMGLSPIGMLDMAYLENDILQIPRDFIPLQSSHTQNGENSEENGRPQSDIEDLSDEGEKSRDKK